MASAMVIVLAYEYGEMPHDEAARYLAIARLLLEYPRWRWGEKLNRAIPTLLDFSRLLGFDIYKPMLSLLPGLNENFLRSLCDQSQTADTQNPATEQMEPPADAFWPEASWANMYDCIPGDDMSEFNLGTIEDQVLLGLCEYPWPGGFGNG